MSHENKLPVLLYIYCDICHILSGSADLSDCYHTGASGVARISVREVPRLLVVRMSIQEWVGSPVCHTRTRKALLGSEWLYH